MHRNRMWTCLSRIVLAIGALFVFLMTACPRGHAAAYPGQGTSQPGTTRSIRSWAHCNGKDDNAGVSQAFTAASHGAFTLVVDCPVFIHVGMDITRPIYIDSGTTVQFTGNGLFVVDNVFVPAFVIANSENVQLLNWKVQYRGGLPVNWNVGGYYDHDHFVQKSGYAQPAYVFNDIALTPWLEAHRGIHFNKQSSIWAGPGNTSAVFFIIGSTKNLLVRDFDISAPANAPDNQFIPVVFSSTPGYKDNETVDRNTPVDAAHASAPSNITFLNIRFDGYYMGWQGRFQTALFKHIRAYRYGDLQGQDGKAVGGIGKWFAPPHLFYLNYPPQQQQGLENRNISIQDVIDYGQRSGTARDHRAPDSGFANSLKIGAIDSEVTHYNSYRPDGFLDLLSSSNLTISDVDATYNSAFLNNLYPGIRFPQPPYHHVVLQNIVLTDTSPITRLRPVADLNHPSGDQIVFDNVTVKLNSWDGTPRGVAPVAHAAVQMRQQPGPASAETQRLCPHVGPADLHPNIKMVLKGKVEPCSLP